MKKLEKAPKWFRDKYFKEASKLRRLSGIDEMIHRINDEYLYWDKLKYQKTGENIEPEIIWTLTKLSRSLSAKRLKFGKYEFHYNITDAIQKSLHEFDLNIGGSLGADNIIPDEDKKRYLISSIMEEAIASSQIEGAATTRKYAKEMLRKNISPKNKSEQMIVNNYQTIKRIVEIQKEPITIERLFEIHRLIAHETLEDGEEGRYRHNNDVNVVDIVDGEVVHIPPDFKEVPLLMNELFEFFNTNDSSRFVHPIIKGCIIHFMIGYIHPFVDGNGRTARALFYWFLLKNGYWLTEYLSISRLIMKSKTQYAMAYLYSETDENDLTYFIHYKIKTMQMAFDSLREYIQRKIKEKKQMSDFQRIKGINERQAIILKWIYEEPELLFNVKEVENRFNVSNQTARTDLTELQQKGFLEAIELNKKAKAYGRSDGFGELIGKVLPAKFF